MCVILDDFLGVLIIKYYYSTTCNMRAVRKVSGHFEYLEKRSRCLHVTWQPVREHLTVHPWTVIVP